MKVLAIVPGIYNTSPGQRYRIEQWEGILKRHDIEITYAPFESKELNRYLYREGFIAKKAMLAASSLIQRFSTSIAASKFDLVYIFREAALIGPAIFEKIIAHRNVPIVYDFDDAIFLPNVSEANARFKFLKFPDKTDDVCRLATCVMTGNSFLAEYAEKFNANVDIVPSTIDTELYVSKSDYELNGRVPTIVWSGSITTLPHLKTLSSALQKLSKRRKFRLRAIGAADFELEGVEVENIRWNAATETDDLRAGDIGIMPLPNDLWSKGKCGMKALQYMGMAIPTICSNVGANADIIQNGENGFLADTEDEWVEKLSELIDSVELRKRIGEAARRTVESKYSAQVQAPRVREIFEKALKLKNSNG